MTKPGDLDARLEELGAMDLEQLRDAWRRQLRTMPPKLSAGLLRLALAHAAQEKALGGLPNATRRRLRETARTGRPLPSILSGMRLARVWKGTTHIVTMGEDGVIRWNDREWRSLSQVAPDLIVLDINIPRMDGIETCRRLRAESDLPILFLSSRDDEIDRILGIGLGAEDLIETRPGIGYRIGACGG